MKEVIIAYENNREKIKSFDQDIYINHHKIVKKVLCKLFTEDESQFSLFNNFKSDFFKFKHYIEQVSNNISNKAQTKLNNISSKINYGSEKLSSLVPTVPTEDEIVQAMDAIGKGASHVASGIEKEASDLRTRYKENKRMSRERYKENKRMSREQKNHMLFLEEIYEEMKKF